MVKVPILTQCEQCEGKAMLPIGEEDDGMGRIFTRYRPCPACQASAKQTKWIPLTEFAALLSELIKAYAVGLIRK